MTNGSLMKVESNVGVWTCIKRLKTIFGLFRVAFLDRFLLLVKIQTSIFSPLETSAFAFIRDFCAHMRYVPKAHALAHMVMIKEPPAIYAKHQFYLIK